ncbi:MAG: radical SAM protein [Kiritimatiellae bacterium]|nr:radical SAM protein [Kiritimatiellia bacterium]
MNKPCELCPRRCGAMRGEGETGFCRAGNAPRIFRWGPHFGEEPPLVNAGGSGAIFFSRCTMRCCYCQNSPWSWRGEGEDVSIERLREMMRVLAEDKKCANWNMVSPTPYLPFIREAAHPLLREGIRLPFVFNTSGYERRETLEEYAEFADVALCDLRYSQNETAIAASAAPGYVEAGRDTMKWFANRLGDGLALDANGLAARGVICRILVLPGHADEAIENLAWIATEISSNVHVSVMSQYTPAFRAKEIAPWNRTVSEDEYNEVAEAAADFGFANGWVQGFDSNHADAALLGENMSPGEGAVGERTENLP